MLHKLKLGFRRKWRAQKQQVGDVAELSSDGFERYFIQRLHKFGKVWRPVIGWLVLMVLVIGCLLAQNQALSAYYQTRQPIPGGVYTVGIQGSFSNANPVYATNDVDKTVSRLLFSGLFKYDNHNKLVGDLAKSWEIDDTGKVYTVTLRNNLRWHDGQPLTAQDVVFTYDVIQSPDAESPLRNNWAGITVEAVDEHTVKFTLPNPLSSFIYGVTNGIIPKHLLSKVPMEGMRSVAFNTQSPVGSGPFMWKGIDVGDGTPDHAQESIGLVGFPDFWAGAPKLKSFVVRGFTSRADMINAYNQQELTAISGLPNLPASIKPDDSVVTSMPLTAETMVFFRTSATPLNDKTVRNALVSAANPADIIKALPYGVSPAREPILKGQLGYDPRYIQRTNHLAEAAKSLDKAGWEINANGIRAKKGVQLEFSLMISNTPEYRLVASKLQKQWLALGARVNIDIEPTQNFRENLSNHQYGAVLYGIAIGADPDVFVYWHSSQADIRSVNRLNLSEYKSKVADEALEAGRTRIEPAIRIIKYQAFLKQWEADAPALALYQPRYLYVSHKKIYGLEEHVINEPADRLYSANNWMIRTARVTNQ
ncbi:hypothetical protein KDA23_03465 [Candidatus Saccharibacteria bacterium]|nr:hypothetical protein [Candidatus Saccharibacteria bacterium]